MPSKEESLAEISNPIRLKILKKVANHPQALAEIAKDLPISKPEVSRHLSRLQDSGFLTKDPSTSKFEPSALGETYLQLFSPIDFVFRYQDYFQDHRIDLPINLMRNIDALMNAEFITGIGEVLMKADELSRTTKDLLRLMTDQMIPIGPEDFKIRTGNYIVSPSIVTPEGQEHVMNSFDDFEGRAMKISHAIMISEDKRGLLWFPGLNGKPDLNSAFFITDDIGLSYLLEIWEHFWNSADKITDS